MISVMSCRGKTQESDHPAIAPVDLQASFRVVYVDNWSAQLILWTKSSWVDRVSLGGRTRFADF